MIVNAWNEGDPLKEVIVGSVRGAADIRRDGGPQCYFSNLDGSIPKEANQV